MARMTAPKIRAHRIADGKPPLVMVTAYDAPSARVAHESGVDADAAERLAVIGERVRNLKQHGFEEGVSTRLLIYTGELIAGGIAPRRAAEAAIVSAISDDTNVQQAVADIVDVVLP